MLKNFNDFSVLKKLNNFNGLKKPNDSSGPGYGGILGGAGIKNSHRYREFLDMAEWINLLLVIGIVCGLGCALGVLVWTWTK